MKIPQNSFVNRTLLRVRTELPRLALCLLAIGLRPVHVAHAATTPLLAASAQAVAASCIGDCDASGGVTIDELIAGVNIALGNAALTVCPVFDCNGSGEVTINCLVSAVNAALNGCPAPPVPSATSTPAATETAIEVATATLTPTPTQPPIDTATAAPSPSASPSRTATATATPTQPPVATATATRSPSASPSRTATATATPTTATSTATLATIQSTIFSPSCTDAGCHNSAVRAGSLNLEAGKSYDELVNVTSFSYFAQQAGTLRVKPGDPANSFLLIKCGTPAGQFGSIMPLGKAHLTADQLQLLKDWITNGALP